jgi:hypothetical protein
MSPSASAVSFKEALLTFLFILFIAIVALSNLVPLTVVTASAPATDFSAERAIEHLKVIAREHPIRPARLQTRASAITSSSSSSFKGWNRRFKELRLPCAGWFDRRHELRLTSSRVP